MNLRDSTTAYGPVSRLNHWLGAALIIVLLGIGLYFEDMPRGDEKLYWLKLHISIGALAFAFLAFRVLWRAFNRVTQEFDQPPALKWLTRIAHGVLLLGIATLIVTGPLLVWTGGHAIDVFGWFSIPSPTGEIHALHEALEGIHAVVAKVLLIAIILHVAGALKHLVFEREQIAGRMIGRPRSEETP